MMEVVLFLFLKTGEKFATQETAGATVADFTRYVAQHMEHTAFEPHVFNDPVKAAEWCGARQPVAGIVTPGFYLAYGKALGLTPVLETHRQGVPAEQFVLVAPAAASATLADWAGGTVVTTLAAEERYVRGVILQNKLGNELRLQSTRDAESAVFDLAEGKTRDPVLLEEATWEVFAADPELGGKLQVIFRSEELPRDLVVAFGDWDADRLKTVLKEMKTAADGQTILRSIRVVEFGDVDRDRLEKARALFQGE